MPKLEMHKAGGTPSETDSSPLKIGHPKRRQSYSNHPFSGAFTVSFREGSILDIYTFYLDPN